MLIKAQIKSLPFGSKFTLHPLSNKFWFKGTEEVNLKGKITLVKGTRCNTDRGVCYYEPNHVVYKLA